MMTFRRLQALVLTTASSLVLALPQALPAQPAGPERIAIDARQLDVYDVVRLLATEAGVNVVVDQSVPHHDVTIRLEHVTFDQALATLAASNGLESVRIGAVTYLGTAEMMNRRYPSHAGGVRTRAFELRASVAHDVASGLTNVLPPGTLIVPNDRASSIIVTADPATLERAAELIADLDAPGADRTLTIAMKYVRADDVLKTLQATYPAQLPASINAIEEQNAIVLAGTPAYLARVSALIARLDRPARQVRYDVQVTDVSPQNDSGNIGFLYSGVTGPSLVPGTSSGGGSIGSAVISFPVKTIAIDATLNALVTQGRAKILARPNISTMNNVAASLLVGEQYPIVYFDARTGTQQVQFVNIGVNLNVTPTIGENGDVVTDLETDYSQIIGTAAGGYPRIGTRKAQSRLRVRDGETIVIAGLFSDFDSTTVTKVPFLGDIPVLGEIFKNRQYARNKDEVVFLLTPHLVTGANQSATGFPTFR